MQRSTRSRGPHAGSQIESTIADERLVPNGDRMTGAAGPGRRVADPLLTPEEAADLLAVPRSWVYAEARAGRLPHIRVGRYVRFREASLLEWITDTEMQTTRYRRYGRHLEVVHDDLRGTGRSAR